MAHTLVIQPDGLYALWSTVSDSFVLLNATEEDVVQFHLDNAERSIREEVSWRIRGLSEQKWSDYCKEYRSVHRLPIHLNTRRVPKRRWIRRKI